MTPTERLRAIAELISDHHLVDQEFLETGNIDGASVALEGDARTMTMIAILCDHALAD